MARRSYVDPRVVTAFDEGRTIDRTVHRLANTPIEQARPAIERAVVRLLKS